jgi:hypothetical protein
MQRRLLEMVRPKMPIRTIVSPHVAPLPERASWLPGVDALLANLIERARRSVGICEDPPGSNRGREIDAWNERAGVPVKSYWCASFVGALWRDSGFDVPAGYASCDAWMAWAKETGRWSANVPTLGCAVLYGKPGDATHIGLVIRTRPQVLSVEGNTTVEGSAFERNGTSVALKLVTAHDPVLGYCHLRPALARAA